MADLTSRLADRLERAAGAAEAATASPGRAARTSVVLGRVLAVMFAICFLTGVYSHLLQDPADWLPLFPRPIWLYQVTQGTHVIVGLASIPVLLGKLWSVFPRLFTWPTIIGIGSLLERASIAILVSSALLEVAIGAMNISQWYPFPFSFRDTHWALAWVLVGSVVLHIAVKLPTIVRYWRAADDRADGSDGADGTGGSGGSDGSDGPGDAETDAPSPTAATAATAATGAEIMSRRGALIAVAAAAGTITLTSAGQTIRPLAPLAALAPRRPGIGPQDLPVNRTARAAGIEESAISSDWRLEVIGGRETSLSLDELRALPQREAELPIACVEGWSQLAAWGGVPIRDLLDLAGIPRGRDLRITSLQTRRSFGVTEMPAEYADDPLTLVALRLGGEPLAPDHGYPARVIAPGRPGVLQTKWITRIEVIR